MNNIARPQLGSPDYFAGVPHTSHLLLHYLLSHLSIKS